MAVNELEIPFFLDSGAKLSYLSSRLLAGRPSLGTVTDFYPGVGRFTTETYLVVCQSNNKDFKVTFGKLPQQLEMMLTIAGTEGILAKDFFDRHKILFNFNRKTFTIL